MLNMQSTIPVSGSVPYLSLMIALPLVVAFMIWAIKPLRAVGHSIALATALADLGLIIAGMLTEFNPQSGATYQLGEIYPWIPQIGLSWALGVNGLSLVMILLASALTPLVLISDRSRDKTESDASNYAALILVLLAFMVLVFAARDLLLFYIAFEGMLIPLYFLIGRFGGENRRHAAIKFVLFSLLGGLVMLVGVIGVYVYSGASPDAFLLDKLTSGNFKPGSAQNWMFLTFFFAFAIKAPMVPVHTWLPTTAQAARPGTSVLLVGVLDKVGTFGMLTLCWGLFPDASKAFALPIIVLAVVSIIYGALAALWQKDILRLVAFTSISHFGFMVMGLYSGSALALSGAMLYMLAHGISIAALFMLAGWLSERGQSQEISAYGGMQRVTPVLAGLFLVSGLAAIALPGLSGFLPEFMVLVGTFKHLPVAAGLAVGGVVLAALYILLPYQRIFTGQINPERKELPDLTWREKGIMVPLVAAMLVLGFLPGPVLGLLDPISVEVTKNTVLAQETKTPNALPTVEGSSK